MIKKDKLFKQTKEFIVSGVPKRGIEIKRIEIDFEKETILGHSLGMEIMCTFNGFVEYLNRDKQKDFEILLSDCFRRSKPLTKKIIVNWFDKTLSQRKDKKIKAKQATLIILLEMFDIKIEALMAVWKTLENQEKITASEKQNLIEMLNENFKN